MVGNVVIPYLTLEGMPTLLRFRCVEEHDHRELHHGKYMSVAGDSPRIFNLPAIMRASHSVEGVLHVTEGEFDAMILTQLGVNAVAVPGANSFRRHQRRMLSGFNRVFVWGDPDEAGAEFALKLGKQVGNAVTVPLRPADGDITELFLAQGREGIESRLREVGGSLGD